MIILWRHFITQAKYIKQHIQLHFEDAQMSIP
jgi:hypothetical protein